MRAARKHCLASHARMFSTGYGEKTVCTLRRIKHYYAKALLRYRGLIELPDLDGEL